MKTIVVAGDRVVDYYLAHHPGVSVYHHQPTDRAVLGKCAGGAWYLKDIVQILCDEAKIIGYDDSNYVALAETGVVSKAYAIWGKYQENLQNKEKKQLAWRVSNFLGCEKANINSEKHPAAADHPTPDVLLLDDLCLGFRDYDNLWPAALKRGGNPVSIILKSDSADANNPLWKHLIEKHADKTTLIISAEALRRRGAAISRALSWDQSIEDIIQAFKRNIFSGDLARFRRVLIRFGHGGIASFTRCRIKFGGPKKASIPNRSRGDGVLEPLVSELAGFERFLYQPEEFEDTWTALRPGRTFGANSILAAAWTMHEMEPDKYPLFITLGRALAATRQLHHAGGGNKDACNVNLAFDTIKKQLRPELKTEPAFEFFTAYPRHLHQDHEANGEAPSKTDLLHDLTGQSLEYMTAKAIDVVLRGTKKALKSVPKARYGKYITVDREEIERINALRGLIDSYRDNPNDRRPLSVGVFGPPGAGKSFAIKQLAAELFKEMKEPIEFNLSQFHSVEDLHRAFHQVRDASVRGYMPLVFWDEFDSIRDGERYGWLKYFLSPMQDAEFRAGGVTHPFGKAIFIFAGGTCHYFESFSGLTSNPATEESFRTSKGPDFISRLRGYVNIKGPNPVMDNSCDCKTMTNEEYRAAARKDPAYLIRRAMLLRSTLERCYPHLIDSSGKASVSVTVISEFLKVRTHFHGARSLESVVNMCSLERARHFGLAELPPRHLLALHVDSKFMSQSQTGQHEAGVIEADEIEDLAEACHEAWRKTKNKIPEADKEQWKNLLKPYADLEEVDKEANREVALLTQARMMKAGYRIKKLVNRESAQPPEFRKDRERLARIEHDRWLRQKLLEGFEWHPETDKPRRLHRDIALYEEVPREDRNLDLAIVDSIPEALRQKGYIIEKIDGDN